VVIFSPPFSIPVATYHVPKLTNQKISMRTVAQKKVYGKRKKNAARAVLDGSPSKTKPIEVNDPQSIEATLAEINVKLEGVTIEESTLQSNGNTETKSFSMKPLQQTPIKIINKSTIPETPKIKTPLESPGDGRIESGSRSEVNNARSTEANGRRKLPLRNKPMPRLSSDCIRDEKINCYVRRILDEALSPLASQGVQKFGSWAARSEKLFEVVKLAEGSYGEVYKLRIRQDVCKQGMSKSRLAMLRAHGQGVFKIVPLQARSGPGSKKFTSVEELASEVKLLKLLDPIPGFARFREIHVVRGRFPRSFQDAWVEYKNTKNDCWNPNPANKRAYPNSQLWAILEMDDAGHELEKFTWSSVFQVYDIFWGVAMALARAEEYAMFEVGPFCICSKTITKDFQAPRSPPWKHLLEIY
jgi:serine/threonine-protein kinase haspin